MPLIGFQPFIKPLGLVKNSLAVEKNSAGTFFNASRVASLNLFRSNLPPGATPIVANLSSAGLSAADGGFFIIN
ncbi:hypothetical protein D3C80_1570280 [compost metagenome]